MAYGFLSPGQNPGLETSVNAGPAHLTTWTRIPPRLFAAGPFPRRTSSVRHVWRSTCAQLKADHADDLHTPTRRQRQAHEPTRRTSAAVPRLEQQVAFLAWGAAALEDGTRVKYRILEELIPRVFPINQLAGATITHLADHSPVRGACQSLVAVREGSP
jgi:hypothetical protein